MSISVNFGIDIVFNINICIANVWKLETRDKRDCKPNFQFQR